MATKSLYGWKSSDIESMTESEVLGLISGDILSSYDYDGKIRSLANDALIDQQFHPALYPAGKRLVVVNIGDKPGKTKIYGRGTNDVGEASWEYPGEITDQQKKDIETEFLLPAFDYNGLPLSESNDQLFKDEYPADQYSLGKRLPVINVGSTPGSTRILSRVTSEEGAPIWKDTISSSLIEDETNSKIRIEALEYTIKNTVSISEPYIIHIVGQSNALGGLVQPSGLNNNNGVMDETGEVIDVPGAGYGVDEFLADRLQATSPYMVKTAFGGITADDWYSNLWPEHRDKILQIPNYSNHTHYIVWVQGETEGMWMNMKESQYMQSELVVFNAFREIFAPVNIISVLLNPVAAQSTDIIYPEGLAPINDAKIKNSAAYDVTVIGGDYDLKPNNVHYSVLGFSQMADDVIAVISGTYVHRA